MEGYQDREKLIRDHWDRYGFHWDLTNGPRLSIPVRHRLYPIVPAEPVAIEDMVPVINKLEFAFERGTLDGQPAYRITCEGIVVEEAPL